MSENSGNENKYNDWRNGTIQLGKLLLLLTASVVILGCIKFAYAYIQDNKYAEAISLVAGATGLILAVLSKKYLTSAFWIGQLFHKENVMFYIGISFLLISAAYIFLPVSKNWIYQLLFIVCGILFLYRHQLNIKNRYKETNEIYQKTKKLCKDAESAVAERDRNIEQLSKELKESGLEEYIVKATEMYQDPIYERVVTTMEKWLCVDPTADALHTAFGNINAGVVHFWGHIRLEINFVGVIWRLNEIFNSKSPSKFRIYHLIHEDAHPLCIIGKRARGYQTGDLILTRNDYSQGGRVLAHAVDVRQKKIAFLLNAHIDSMLTGYTEHKNKDENIRDGLLVVLEVLKTFKNRLAAQNHDPLQKDLEDIDVPRKDYVKFVADRLYETTPPDISHIMDKDSFSKTLDMFLTKLIAIRAITLVSDVHVNFVDDEKLQMITYEKALCRLNKCDHKRNKQGICPNGHDSNN